MSSATLAFESILKWTLPKSNCTHYTCHGLHSLNLAILVCCWTCNRRTMHFADICSHLYTCIIFAFAWKIQCVVWEWMIGHGLLLKVALQQLRAQRQCDDSQYTCRIKEYLQYLFNINNWNNVSSFFVFIEPSSIYARWTILRSLMATH